MEPFEPDPGFLRSRRETGIILLIWAACLIWTVVACAATGYDLPEGPAPTFLGIPRWIVIGVVLPWAVATVATIVFCLRFVKDDDDA